MTRLIRVLIPAALALLSSGCVMKSTHDMTLQELNTTKNALGDARETIASQEATITKNREELENNQVKIGLAHDELAKLELKKLQLQNELADANNKLQLSQSQLETMRQIEAETQKRNDIYARFVKELQKMIDGGQLTVSIEGGRIVINLPDEVLFRSGSATLGDKGKGALAPIAAVLARFTERRFQVEGYTDNVPIKSERYATNWELSAARALSVVHLLIDEGVAPQNLSAAGFGEYRPRATNDTPEGRAQNRRIEIVMLPNLDILSDELPKLTR